MPNARVGLVVLIIFCVAATWHPRRRSKPSIAHLERMPDNSHYNLSIITISRAADRDLEYFENQVQSCTMFFNMNDIETWWMVVPPARVDHMREYLRRLCSDRRWCAPWRVISEEEIFPRDPLLVNLDSERRHRFLKLAAARIMRTNYYLIFDSDILCTRRTTASDLFVGSRAKAYLYNGDSPVFWDVWVKASEQLLELELPVPRRCMDVTPQIFHRDVLSMLELHLQITSGRTMNDIQKSFHRWAEYMVYYLIATNYDLWNQYHAEVPLRQFLRESVWDRDAADKWNTDAVFDPHSPGFFTVFQTNTRLSGLVVREKIQRYIPAEPFFPYVKRET